MQIGKEKMGMYKIYEQKAFVIDGHKGMLVCPQTPREDGKYIWRTAFSDSLDAMDHALLMRGWYVAYYDISGAFGAPSAVESMRRFQEYIEQEFSLSAKAPLFGFGVGGLCAVNYAAAYPEKVAKLYLDAPVLDIFSWPGGYGRGKKSVADWELCRALYQVADGARNVPENPINHIKTLIENRIQVFLVTDDADLAAPFRENGQVLYAEYIRAGAPVKLIEQSGKRQSSYGLEHPEDVADWVEFDTELGCMIETGAQNWQIFQQAEDGYAEVTLCGRCVSCFSQEKFHAFVRVVNEADGTPVLRWTRCETADNRWWVNLSIPTGGLYRIETCMDAAEICNDWSVRGDCIYHIGVGDVYVIAGQSNAAGMGKDFVSDFPELGVHLLKNSGRWDIATHPMSDSTETIHPQNRDGINTGHSPFLSFGKYMKRELGYPIGLVQTALGGSPLRSWSAPHGNLYRSMIAVLKKLNGVKGILWYQGCCDADPDKCGTYGERFAQMVQDVRRELEQPNLPFFTCQIYKVMYQCEEQRDRSWGIVREAQRMAARKIPNVFVIPATGGGMADVIHNSAASNLMLGERLARCALGHLYQRNVMCDAPDVIRAVKCGNTTIRLEFSNIYCTLEWISESAVDKIFFLESERGIAAPVSAKITGKDTVELEFSEELPQRCVVHGAYQADLPYPPVSDSASKLPMLSFYGLSVDTK